MKIALAVAAVCLLAALYIVVKRSHVVQPPVTVTSVVPVPTPKAITRRPASSFPKDTKEVVDISGSLKNRGIVNIVLPKYPEWAEVKGVTADVSAKIWVHPEGHVSSFIQMTRVSTEPQLDELAMDALRQWRFAAIPNSTEKQAGIVTFHFSLNNNRPQQLALAR